MGMAGRNDMTRHRRLSAKSRRKAKNHPQITFVEYYHKL